MPDSAHQQANSRKLDTVVTLKPSQEDPAIARAIEASIHIALITLLVAACLVILIPFVTVVAWGAIIAIASYPAFLKMQNRLGGRSGWAAALWTLLLLAVLLVPVVLLGKSLVDGVQTLVTHLQANDIVIPSPPPKIATWPLIGAPIHQLWSTASGNLTEALKKFSPQIKAFLPKILSVSAGLGLTVLQFVLSLLVSGALLAKARDAAQMTELFARRVFGERGPEFQHLVGATIRSVTSGILGVAVIQTILATVGFLVAGLPGAGLWAALFLMAAILQVGLLILIPAVAYMFVIASTTKAIIFLVWCAFVGLIDNVLKPLLLGRGVEVPIIVVFLGAIGGFVSLGIIGLFVGAIVLSVGYKLFLAWIEREGNGGATAPVHPTG